MASTPKTVRKAPIITLTSRTCTAWLTNITSSTLKSCTRRSGALSWPTSRSSARASRGSRTAKNAAPSSASIPSIVA
jgi:hypothetical protein